MKILVAEDEFLLAWMLQDSLIAAGYEVLGPVATVDEALELLQRSTPDLALIDIRLAGGQLGTDLARILRTEYDVRSIFVTANVAEATQAADVAFGAIEKPYQPKTIVASIQAAEQLVHNVPKSEVRSPPGMILF